jgi:hypothetical protein
VACGAEDDGSGTPGTGSGPAASSTDPIFGDTGDSSGSTTLPPLPDPSGGGSGPSQTSACRRYLECAAELAVAELDSLDAMFGPEGTCWDDGADEASACNQTCQTELLDLVAGLEAMGQVIPAACEPPQDVSYVVIEQMLSDNCVAGCHEPGGDFADLPLDTDPRGEIVSGFSSQVGMLLVEAGDHEQSYLWHKVAGSHGSVGGSGSRMPRGAPPLSQGQIDDLANWIDSGANP